MQKSLPTTGQLLTQSWNLAKQEWKATLKWTLGLAVFTYVMQILNIFLTVTSHRNDVPHSISPLSFLVSVLTLLGALFFTVGLLRYLSEKTAPEIRKRPLYWNTYVGVLIAVLLTFPLLLIGFFFLILPGIWIGVALSYSSLEVVENGHGATDAMRASYNLVKGRWWAVFGRNAMLALIIAGIDLAVWLGFILILAVVAFITLRIAPLQGALTAQSIGAYVKVPSHAAFLTIGVFAGLGFSLLLSTFLKVFSVLLATSWQVNMFHALKDTAEKTSVTKK